MKIENLLKKHVNVFDWFLKAVVSKILASKAFELPRGRRGGRLRALPAEQLGAHVVVLLDGLEARAEGLAEEADAALAALEPLGEGAGGVRDGGGVPGADRELADRRAL